MKSPINELISTYINARPKLFIEYETVIFFNKDDILKAIKKRWWRMSAFKTLKKAENKLKKRNINFYYLSEKQLNEINGSLKFRFNNENKPKFNELYFKLNDYNANIVKYYSYNNFLRYSEDYNYDFFVYLFSYFGLKSMRWSYTNTQENTNERSISGDLGIKDQKNEFQFSTNETSKNSLGIEGFKNFENNGSDYYFDTCERRAFWYSFCKKDIDDVVKLILDKSDRYSYEYYKNNESLQIRLENRLRGAKQICYEISNNTHHKTIVTKMIKISNTFGCLGIKLNTNNIDTKNYTKKFSINFWDIEDMELRTLENLLSNEENINKDIIMERVHKRYNELHYNDINNLSQQLLDIERKIKVQTNKSNRLSFKMKS